MSKARFQHSGKIRTQLDLNNVMTEEFAWRKKELHHLKSLVLQNQKTYLNDLSIRSAVALLYAHWEGFIRGVASAYVEFVSRQQVPCEQLSDSFLAIAVRSLLRDAAESRRIKSHVAVVEFFRKRIADRSNLAFVSAVSTQSNLNSDVLQDIILTIGLEYAPYETKEKLIDERLLRSRNSIAHGQYLTMDTAEYVELHEEIQSLMQLFYNQVDNAARTSAYRV